MFRRAQPGKDEGDAEGEIEDAGEDDGRGDAVLPCEAEDGDGVGEFFEDGGEHERAVAAGAGADQEEGELPGKDGAEEAVVELGVVEGRRVRCAVACFEDVERGDSDDAEEAGEPEDGASERHRVSV